MPQNVELSTQKIFSLDFFPASKKCRDSRPLLATLLSSWCGEKLIHEIEIEIAQPRIFHHQLVAKQFYCQQKYLHEVVFTLSSHKMNGILKKPIANHSKHDNNAAPNPSRHLHTCHTSLLSSSPPLLLSK